MADCPAREKCKSVDLTQTLSGSSDKDKFLMNMFSLLVSSCISCEFNCLFCLDAESLKKFPLANIHRPLPRSISCSFTVSNS